MNQTDDVFHTRPSAHLMEVAMAVATVTWLAAGVTDLSGQPYQGIEQTRAIKVARAAPSVEVAAAHGVRVPTTVARLDDAMLLRARFQPARSQAERAEFAALQHAPAFPADSVGAAALAQIRDESRQLKTSAFHDEEVAAARADVLLAVAAR